MIRWWWKKSKMRQTDGEICCVLGLEESMLWEKTIQTNLYCENDHTTQSNLPIQTNPYQITNGIFHGTRTKYPTIFAAAAAKSLQSCPTLCDPIDGSPPGPAIPGILQARTLEWVAISFSNAWKWKGKVKSFSCVRLLATPLTAAYQAPPSMGFSRQEYRSGVPLPTIFMEIQNPEKPKQSWERKMELEGP